CGPAARETFHPLSAGKYLRAVLCRRASSPLRCVLQRLRDFPPPPILASPAPKSTQTRQETEQLVPQNAGSRAGTLAFDPPRRLLSKFPEWWSLGRVLATVKVRSPFERVML